LFIDYQIPSGVFMNERDFKLMAAKIGRWFVEGDTGLSSEFMAAVALGYSGKKRVINRPYDGGDFGRCLRLVEKVPEIRHYFSEIASASTEWEVIIKHWDELVSLSKSGENVHHHLRRLIDPEEHQRRIDAEAENIRREKEVQEAHKKAIEHPIRNRSGALKLPSTNNPFVLKEIVKEPAVKLTDDLIASGFLDESGRDDNIDELVEILVKRPFAHGYDLEFELGFVDRNDVCQRIEILDCSTTYMWESYHEYLFSWCEAHGAKPSFKVGEFVRFLRDGEQVTGQIESVDKPYFPFRYTIFVEELGERIKPMIWWDDDSLELAK
jgi:hypothetical protein